MLRRWIFVGLACAVACTGAAAAYLHVTQSQPQVNLVAAMETGAIPGGRAVDPDELWTHPLGPAPGDSVRVWSSQPEERIVGRITLVGSRERDVYVVLVPSARVDQVQVFWRHEGDSWKGAEAGDRVALSRWPFVGPFPAFPVPVGEQPVQLLVVMANEAQLSTQVLIEPDSAYRESQTRQSQLSGLRIGLGLMVILVCLITALAQRSAAAWTMVSASVAALFAIMCANGDTAIWFTPEWPVFNDGSKHLSTVMMSALTVPMVMTALDSRYTSWLERTIAWSVPVLGLVYCAVQAMWLPNGWRLRGAVLFGVLVVAICAALCARSALKGGRYVRLVGAALVLFAVAVASSSLDFPLLGGLELRSTLSATLVLGSVLLIRQTLVARERYGRDVLGRAAVGANRDPLTALLSYPGFQLACDEIFLKQSAGEGQACVMLFMLPGLEQSGVDHGYVVTERAVVRFAATLQAVLGDAWSIARLSKTRFAYIGLQCADRTQLQAVASRVLARCYRLSEPLAPVADFDLKIACTLRKLPAEGLRAMVLQLEDAVLAMEPGKRIVVV